MRYLAHDKFSWWVGTEDTLKLLEGALYLYIDMYQCIGYYERMMNDLVMKLKALADPTRLAILEFLMEPAQGCCVNDDGVCACDVENLLGMSQPTVSHHMKILQQAGLVNAEKRGRWMFYEINPAGIDSVVQKVSSLRQKQESLV